ncbi:hypothetical protein Sango_0652500 [Sesamum angolense]|uniref:Uncharacterized protein n=1 Tax=Sesamum angolense TaxID=2727404 RepID=A0AAE2C2M5_9LAMI|nr:hypothetical protein Sango_0652500 [Sesamum angolense]
MKDNLNLQKDLKIICNRLKLEVDVRRPNVMPKALYTLTKEQKMRICEWISHLKFPDGYTSNLARCVDIKKMRLHGMKNHDFHILCSTMLDVNKQILWKRNKLRRNDELYMNDTRIHRSIFNYPDRACGASKKPWHNGSEHHIIEMYIMTNCEVVTPYYDSSYTDTDNDLYGILEEIINFSDPTIEALPFVLSGFHKVILWFDRLDSGYPKSSVLRTSSNHTTAADGSQALGSFSNKTAQPYFVSYLRA